MEYEWKSLANAIVHDGFDPLAQVTIMCCESCKNPFMHILMQQDYKANRIKDSRISVAIYHCPLCGHNELDVTGTYDLKEVMPGTILPFVGHFLGIWSSITSMIAEAEGG